MKPSSERCFRTRRPSCSLRAKSSTPWLLNMVSRLAMTSVSYVNLFTVLWRHCPTWLATWIVSWWPASAWHGAAKGIKTTVTSSSFSKRCPASPRLRCAYRGTTYCAMLFYSRAPLLFSFTCVTPYDKETRIELECWMMWIVSSELRLGWTQERAGGGWWPHNHPTFFFLFVFNVVFYWLII